MKAIILAAGEGKRLRPYTDNLPKCMVQLNDRPLIDWQIEVMQKCGIDDIIVIKGYRAEKITREDVKYYINNNYEITNMVSTLWCAESELNGELIISYGDIVYTPEVLKALLKSSKDISVVVDLDWEEYWKKRFEDPLSDAESLVLDKNGKILSIGQKTEDYSDIQAQYIGLMKFSQKGINVLKDTCKSAIRVSSKGEKLWNTGKFFREIYMTDLLQGMIDEANEIYAVKINRGWYEVDSITDLKIAENEFIFN